MNPAYIDSDRFARLWIALGAEGDPGAWSVRLGAAYGEPHRAYHTAEHIGGCLRVLDGVREAAERPAEIELALWFHDAVYDPRAKDNEARSAALLREMAEGAGLGPEVADRGAALVLATAHEAEPGTPDATLTVDIDLSILGADEHAFDRYEAQVRREYAFVPDADFAVGRAAILAAFLARPAIYRTSALHDRLEPRARANLTRSLAALGQTG